MVFKTCPMEALKVPVFRRDWMHVNRSEFIALYLRLLVEFAWRGSLLEG
jgi:hypothetical protein